MAETKNPFIGPRPFEIGETLFGRDRELAELRYLLTSERIVLLHSPSGAGKSSLIRAGLISQLSKKFDVWRPTRVNQQPPDGVLNRYAWSAASGFEQELPEDLRRDPNTFAQKTLKQYFDERPRRPGAPKSVVLIFDQFEEVLRVDPLDIAAKTEFFNQLGELLVDPHVWALFALREDYLAPLDPYCKLVPTHLRNRYRIDLLSLDAAKEAIAKPAPAGGRVFTEAAVEKLVTDLAKVKVQQPDLSFAEQVGLSVEPLQLQVVCRSLWDRMPAEDLSVDPEDIEHYGNVTSALSDYYAHEVSRIAGGDAVKERPIRQWMEKNLITADNIRNQVLRTAEKSEGLENRCIAALVDAFLVRAEQRAGSVWYELSHDRLIEPVRNDNMRWRESNLAGWQKSAMLWDKNRNLVGMLLCDHELAEVTQAIDSRQITPDAMEMEYIQASREKQKAIDQQRRFTSVLRWQRAFLVAFGVIATISCIVAARLYIEADHRRDREEKQAQAEADLAKKREEEFQYLISTRAAAATVPKPRVLTAKADAPRIYMHVRDGFQRKAAVELRKRLEEKEFKVMGIETLPFGAEKFSVRYFFVEDADAANKIAGLVQIGSGPVKPDYITRYQGTDQVRPGHLEIWYGPEPETPPSLRPPSGQSVVASAKTRNGKMNFTCREEYGMYRWMEKDAASELVGEKGELVGKHYAGVTWESTDGSKVTADAIVGQVQPDSKSAPWRLLRVSERSGVGVVGRVAYIQRVGTEGGVAPPESCGEKNANATVSVNFSAYYYFYAGRTASAK